MKKLLLLSSFCFLIVSFSSGQFLEISQPQSASHPENTPSDSVHRIVAIAFDYTGITFEIIGGNDEGAWDIDTTGGTSLCCYRANIYVTDSSLLDFETKSLYLLNIRVTLGSTVKEGTIAMSLTNKFEVDSQSFHIKEKPFNGDTVGTVVTEDHDSIIKYLITGGNTDNAFSMDINSGTITVNDSTNIEHAKNPVYELETQVIAHEDTVNTVMTIFVIDDAIEEQTFSIEENPMNEDSVGVVATSSDSSLVYSIVYADPDSAFAIDTATGKIYVLDSSLVDFEKDSLFKLVVNVNDGACDFQDTIRIVVIDIDETVPSIDAQEFSLDENPDLNFSVGTVVATDEKPLAYAIIDGNTDGAFGINPSTGEIKVVNPTPVDFEVNPTFSLEVEVDDATNKASAVVTINVNDVDETPIAIKELSQLEFSIYPNPIVMGGEINITVPSNEDVQVSLMDNTGKLIETYNDVNGSISVNMSAYPRGNYFVQVATDTKIGVQKITVQ